MFLKILSNSWKSFLRSPAFSQNLATTIMMGLFGLYFLVCFLALGAGAPFIMKEVAPDANGPMLIGRYFMYFIIYSFLMRLIFQNFGFKSLKQYILQKVPKKTIFHYLLFKTGLSPMNIIPFIGIAAYLVSAQYAPDYNINILTHGLVMVGLLFASNYKAFLFDKQLSINKVVTGIIIAAVIIINFLDYKGILPLGDLLEWLYSFFVTNIGTAIIPFIGAIVTYFLSFKSLTNVAYLEDDGASNTVTSLNLKSGLFSRFGKAGELMEMETKLILRNKRSRNMLFMIPFMFIYPLIIHSSDGMESIGWKMFVAIFCTGGVAMTYGQLLLSWNSDHFDLLLTKMTSIREIFKAKYLLQCFVILIQGSIMILWGFYRTEYFYLMPAMTFYNIGVVLFMYMLLASYNSKKIDAKKGAMMNSEGMSIALFLIIIPIMIIPLAFYFGFGAIGQHKIGVFLLALLGVVGFIFHNRLIDISVNLFKKNRYKIGKAFRTK